MREIEQGAHRKWIAHRIYDAPVQVNALGTVQLGNDSLDAVIRNTGLAFSVHESGIDDCNYVYPPPVIAGLQFMTNRGIVVRAEIFHPRFKTPSGARVGDTIARLKSIYAGRLEETTERYSDNPQFWVHGVLKGYAMRFETNRKKVTSITTGLVSAVMLDEGCF